MPDLEDREEIRDMYSRYCFYVDVGRADLFARSFAPDGVLWLSDRGSYRGRAEIEAHVGRRSGKTFHLIHNVTVAQVEEEHAVSHAYFQLLSPEDATCVAYGTYDDLLTRTAEGWAWQIKKVNYEFQTEAYAAVAATMQRPDASDPPPSVPSFADRYQG